MKIRMSLFLLVAFLVAMSCSSERSWIGTYALEITEETKEAYEMFQEMEMIWPEITLNEDVTFLLLKTEGHVKISGTYTVEETTLILQALDVGGKPPEGKYAEPHSAEFTDGYQVLMMEGPDKERWVRKEVNEAFLGGN